MVSLKLFGGLSLQSEGVPLTGPATQRHRLALLALLATSHPQAVSREKAMAFLWPERDAEHARNVLNQAVYWLRKALGEEAILSTPDELRFSPEGINADVLEFEGALEQHEQESAVGFYQGPFLDGFFLNDAPEFERWVDGERERYSGRYARALEALAERAEAEGDVARAVEWWKLRAAHDPYDSRLALRLMRSLDASGNRAGAIQHAAIHQRLLLEELEMEPEANVATLAERMRGGEAPVSMVRREGEPASTAGGRHGALAGLPGSEPASARFSERSGKNELPGPARPPAHWKRLAGVGMAILAVATIVWVWAHEFGSAPAEIRRIAVLPLANLTGDPKQDYFVAGMHDALIAELAQIEALTVYSRQSVLRYDGSDLPLPAIARELRADALVEGSVFQSGDSVRITVQLVRARPEGHVWAASQYGTLSQALALQGEVARAIAVAVEARVAPEVEARLAHVRTVHPQAQQAYLRGVYHLERGSYGELVTAAERLAEQQTAVRYFEEAAELDPGWAAPHAKLALAFHGIASTARGDHEAEYYRKAKAAALRALELDETESQAHASLGFVLLHYDWDWAGAERAIRRALELDPNSHHWIYASYLQAAGRHDEAIAHFHMAEERNPRSERLKMQVAAAYSCAGRHQEAVAQITELQTRMGGALRSGLVGDAAGTGLLGFLERQYSLMGRHQEAVALAEVAVALSDSLPAAVVNLAFVYARAGRAHDAHRLAEGMEESARATGERFFPAQLYAALGETERALDMVEAALADRRGVLPSVRCSITYRLLRDEPRMQALLQQVRFPH